MTRALAHHKPQHTVVTLLSIKMLLRGCSSLKEKRGHLQPLMVRLRRQFNIAVAETGLQDYWQSAIISCAIVSNDVQLNTRACNEIIEFITMNYPDLEIEEHHTEHR